MRLFLGTHEPGWFRRPEFVGVPLMISWARLNRINLGRFHALEGIEAMLDLCGFTQLQQYGRWTFDTARAVRAARLVAACIPGLVAVGPQDWMCEPLIREGGEVRQGGRVLRFAGTGLTVREHQRRTVENYVDLVSRAPEIPWIPVLQGWEPEEYLECLDLYDRAGVDLRAAERVGIGSVCRRQHTDKILDVVLPIRAAGVRRVHLFGVKGEGMARLLQALREQEETGEEITTDSLAWSDGARWRKIRLPGCSHRTCANCPRYALRWRDDLNRRLAA